MDLISASSDSESNEAGALSLVQYLPLLRARSSRSPTRSLGLVKAAVDVVRSLFPSMQALLQPSCRWTLSPIVPARGLGYGVVSHGGRGRRGVVAGTFFGRRKGRVSFAVQVDSRSEPVLLLELAVTTCDLVKEMASGTVRILLECERAAQPDVAGDHKKQSNRVPKKQRPIWDEPLWTMYCNGHRCGYAVARQSNGFDLHVLSTVRAVSVGAGVLPSPPAATPLLPEPDASEPEKPPGGKASYGKEAELGEVVYMRAKFERVMGSKDSEAFYLINPDSARHDICGGPDLCIFLLRM
ncbi:protein MIZU-KUSSEI 1-like [Zingiber officinale]|uniref:Protein MIZU-KUSSEI 1 n=1 Tax=Zingiber officinale TaxID=94328 RepID=A0A8J5IVC0_ZINOF|nr:protein MIZU-KUSSEI 1-like [Zingiber officinale]KAG6539048.1 hypothetical protein ZIOFF_004201 [Zingiber officinale]